MPRQIRMEYPGAIYHVMSRGNRKQGICVDDADRQDFLNTLAETCRKTGFQVHAYCLMRDHFRLVVETPNANLVAGMHWLLSSYTIRLNRRRKLLGHVFSGRYKAVIVEGGGNGYLRTACDYVHLSPVRARLLGLPTAPAGLSVEQFGLVPGRARASSGLDTGGPFAGGAWDWEGQQLRDGRNLRGGWSGAA